MPDEITIKPKSESTSTNVAPENQNVNLGRTQLVNLGALGLGISFFLPWVNFLLALFPALICKKPVSGNGCFGSSRYFATSPSLPASPSQKIVGQLAGALPFAVGVYWYSKLGSDMLHILTYGAYLSLIFGAALLILPRKSK